MKSGCCSGHMRKKTFYGLFIHNNAPGRRLINCLFRFIPEGYVHTFAAWRVVLLCLFLPTGSSDSAVLYYRFTGEKEVDLMSTYVPETFRGQGLAADLSRVGSQTCKMHIEWVLHGLVFTGHFFFLPQAAMDFLVQENLKAHISCWYIKKYIAEHPEERYGERVIG